MDCPLHEKLDERLRLCEEARIMTGENTKKVDVLFTYHDEMLKTMQGVRDAVGSLERYQHSWSGDLQTRFQRMSEKLSGHLDNYENFQQTVNDMKKEFDAFQWFRNQMNWLKDRLPWWVLGLFVILFVSVLVSLDALKKIIGLLNGRG